VKHEHKLDCSSRREIHLVVWNGGWSRSQRVTMHATAATRQNSRYCYETDSKFTAPARADHQCSAESRSRPEAPEGSCGPPRTADLAWRTDRPLEPRPRATV